jgi:thiol:disulfide interchange protein
MPILGFAEDRNIWANEFRDSPSWLRYTVTGFCIYFVAITLLCIFVGNMHVPSNFFLTASAFMLAFTLCSACVLWVTARSAKSNVSDLRKRASRSLVGIALFASLYLSLGYFLQNRFPVDK